MKEKCKWLRIPLFMAVSLILLGKTLFTEALLLLAFPKPFTKCQLFLIYNQGNFASQKTSHCCKGQLEDRQGKTRKNVPEDYVCRDEFPSL